MPDLHLQWLNGGYKAGFLPPGDTSQFSWVLLDLNIESVGDPLQYSHELLLLGNLQSCGHRKLKETLRLQSISNITYVSILQQNASVIFC